MLLQRRNIRRALLRATALAGAASLGWASPAAAQVRQVQFDIAPQPLSSALRAYGESAEQQLIYSEADVRRFTAPALQGAYTADEGLAMLLAGTGLLVERTPSGILRIVDAQAPQSGSAAGDGAEGTVEALIVTAQKREEDIQDVPIAISAFTQEDLTRSQVAGGPDLITQVPNMTFTKTNFSSYSVQLRGIGTQAISATTDPAVAVAFNNTPFIRNRFFEQEFYDLQRVEVLRGPQGTLYGRNATAGVVNIISNKPKFMAEAKLSADVSNFNSSRLEGMLNVPLAEDRLALRIAGAWTKRDGYAVNELTGNPIDGRDLWSTRVSLRLAPTDTVDVNLIWEHFEENDDRLRSGKQLCKKDVVTEVGGIPVNYFDDLPGASQSLGFSGVQGTLSQGCARESLYSDASFQTPVGLMLPYYVPLGAIGLPINRLDPYVNTVQSRDLRVIESSVDPEYTAKTDIGELQISIDLSDTLTLTSETAYGSDTVFSKQDFNRFNTAPGAWMQPEDFNGRPGLLEHGPEGGIFCDPQLGCSDRLVAVDVSTADSTQFSQELRLGSDFDGPFNFSLGANFLRADSLDKYYVFINSFNIIAGQGPVFSVLPPYVGGQSDNSECLPGLYEGNPNDVYAVTGCIYMDPNSIENVNDRGHNYFLSTNPYKLISYAVFGEAYYQITDTLKLTGGLRWTVDKKEAPRVPSWVLASRSAGYPVAEVIEQKWTEPTGRLTLDWKPDLAFTDETLVYASLAHGYKAGGANPPGFVRVFYATDAIAARAQTSATRPKVFDPEFVDAFELGSKNTLLDGALTLNLAAFYYDYEGYQVSEIVDRSAFNQNFDATVWGVEVEADWRPLENLKLGFKGGYEKTRIADGEQAIDLMDRTAGDPNWMLVRPFPTFASSCILPAELFVGDNPTPRPVNVGGVGSGNPGGCELAYAMGLDPVTQLPYVPDPVVGVPGANTLFFYNDYEGFNPETAPNNGEGIFKQLGGNELPNAPNWTATITGDYTIPLPNEWLATLHTDLHWQSESWWRIFNDHEFSRLDEYFTMNLAAIFTHEEAGWNVMAYIKNVTDETAITGAFLNSDDTGLTTNVFLTEPRLYGLRVTKNWSGGSLLGSFGATRDGPYPFTVELEGQMQWVDAPDDHVAPTFMAEFPDPVNPGQLQDEDLGWSGGGSVKVAYRTRDNWSVSLALRQGRSKGSQDVLQSQRFAEACQFAQTYCDQNDKYAVHASDWANSRVSERETFDIADFMVGRDVGIGALSSSTISAGLRYAQFKSTTSHNMDGVTNWDMPLEYAFLYYQQHHRYEAHLKAAREFEGVGPTVAWDASHTLLDLEDAGKVDLAWSLSGGVLFGKQRSNIDGSVIDSYYDEKYANFYYERLAGPVSVTPSSIAFSRSKSTTVSTGAASLGVSYKIGGASVGAGYRWERYFDVIDGGYDEHRDYDRTVDGPYFRLSVGFGG